MKMLAQPKSAVLTIAVAFGMAGLALPAQTNTNSKANGAHQTANAQTSPYTQDEVKDAQQKLKDDGYYNGKVDGEDGPQTRAAIRKYQQDQHLSVNGSLDQETRNKLGVKK